MNNTQFYYKATLRGEGKTKWLMARAWEEAQEKSKIVMLTDTPAKYLKFVHDYFEQYKTVCPVELNQDVTNIPENAIVLIDNLLEEDFNSKDVGNLRGHVKTVYITLEGTVNLPARSEEYEQIRLEI